SMRMFFSLLLCFPACVCPLALSSFPTRRSSDLNPSRLTAVFNARNDIPPRNLSPPVRAFFMGGRRIGEHRYQIGTTSPPGHNERSEEHTSELQSRENLVCRLLLEKKKKLQRTQS